MKDFRCPQFLTGLFTKNSLKVTHRKQVDRKETIVSQFIP
jgi:hypothetical protein